MDIIKSCVHPDEFLALIKYKFGSSSSVKYDKQVEHETETLQRCYNYLNKTSRSFAAVIRSLDSELRNAVCIFYLTLRALDTVEDDMSIPISEKISMLKTFYVHLEDTNWSYMNSKETDKIVLEDFKAISTEYLRLAPGYREVISDICRQMGEGMTVYLDKSPGSLSQWDEYCHYVAGLVGIGLTKIFVASGLEDKVLDVENRLSNVMGLFLQKTNIIRDYLEDVLQKREFWPQEIWGKYAEELIQLSNDKKRGSAVICLNELVTNAICHIPDCILYMSRLHNQSVFNFCAIPQVMAIATLERCYNNPNVFTGVVKIRKGEAVRLMLAATNISTVKAIMTYFLKKIKQRIPQCDPNASATRAAVDQALTSCRTEESFSSISSSSFFPLYVSFTMMLIAVLWHWWASIHSLGEPNRYS